MGNDSKLFRSDESSGQPFDNQNCCNSSALGVALISLIAATNQRLYGRVVFSAKRPPKDKLWRSVRHPRRSAGVSFPSACRPKRTMTSGCAVEMSTPRWRRAGVEARQAGRYWDDEELLERCELLQVGDECRSGLLSSLRKRLEVNEDLVAFGVAPSEHDVVVKGLRQRRIGAVCLKHPFEGLPMLLVELVLIRQWDLHEEVVANQVRLNVRRPVELRLSKIS